VKINRHRKEKLTGQAIVCCRLKRLEAARPAFGTSGRFVQANPKIGRGVVNLTQPSSDLASGLFGRSTDQSLPRAAQLGVRFQF